MLCGEVIVGFLVVAVMAIGLGLINPCFDNSCNGSLVYLDFLMLFMFVDL